MGISEKKAEIKEMVCEILEIEPEEMTETSLFIDDHDADSLRAIEILAALEKSFKVKIPQEELSKMVNLQELFNVVQNYAKWTEE